MSELIGTLTLQGQNSIPVEIRRKEDQNEFSGIAWQAAGTSLCFMALATTAATAAFIAQASLVGLGVLSEGYFYTPHSLLEGCALTGAAVIGDIAFVRGVASCFTHAIYHLGPDIEMVYPPLKESHTVCPMDQVV